MKKLIVAIIFLYSAAISNADLLITVDGVINPDEILMIPSDTVNIGIWGDGQSEADFYYMGLTLGSPAALDISGAGDNVFWVDYETTAQLLGIENPFVGMDLFTDLVPFPPEPTPLEGMLVENIILHNNGTGVMFLVLFDSNFNELDRQLLMEIPEPATMVLMGIGGIMLMRKRR